MGYNQGYYLCFYRLYFTKGVIATYMDICMYLCKSKSVYIYTHAQYLEVLITLNLFLE